MCGICGKLSFDPAHPVDECLIRDMMTALSHRGPDDEGCYLNGPAGLGQRRLSIVDIAGGRQPVSNEDGSCWIVFNGEIYNHLELRAELEKRGHRYRTRCDTETILHAYEEFGTECAGRLRGMFAFAIWDEKDQTLFAARDRFGIKPFYYWQNAAGLTFASEMKAIMLDPDLEVTLDPLAVFDYFTYKYVPGPKTPWREIRRLQPAHWMRVHGGNVRIERYWTPVFNGLSPHSEEENLELLEVLIKDVIRDHRMSEVPQGVFLSGGIDSSLIVALMSAICPEPIQTFSVTFSHYPKYDESVYAREVATACRTVHHEYDCTSEAIGRLPEMLWHVEEPLADASMIPLHELCRQAKRDVTVVHCGDGGDEVFGGYPRFYWDHYAHAMARLPEPVRLRVLAPLFRRGARLPDPVKEFCRRGEKFSRFAGLPDPERYMNWFTIMPDSVKRRMLHPDFLRHVDRYRSQEVFETIFGEANALRLDALGIRQYCELHSFIPDDLMLKSDKIAMASGLEGRFPFLDERLVEFGLALPPRQKIAHNRLKLPLRKLLARHMPGSFINRGKHGFEVPVTEWFKGSLAQTLRDTIAECRSDSETIFNLAYLENMIGDMRRNDPIAGRQLFKVFMFQQWRTLFARPRSLCQSRLKGGPLPPCILTRPDGNAPSS